MTANFSRKMIEFIDERNISYRTIQRRTGMSLANIKRFKNDPNYGLTISWLTRLLAAFRKEKMAEHIFDDMPDLQDYLFKQPKAWNILTEEDLVKFDIIMHDFFLKEGDAYYKLLDLFYILKSVCADTKKSKRDAGTDLFKDVQEKRARYISEINFLEDDLSCYFMVTQEHIFEPNDYLYTIVNYPKLEFDEYIDMLENGETITWTDVAAFMKTARKKTGLSAERLNNAIGLGTGIVIRAEKQMTKSFLMKDIIKIDNYFEMEGAFVAMCIRATQNSIIAADIMKEVDNILFYPDADPKGIEKTVRSTQFDKAANSFICMVRYIRNFNGYSGLYNAFITEYRNSFSYSDNDNEKLNLYVDSYYRYISSTDLLKNYRFPKY